MTRGILMNGINMQIRVVILGGVGVILAGLRFFYLGENTGGTGGLVIGFAMIAFGLLLTRQHGVDINKLMSEGWCVDADFDSAERPVYSAKPSRQMYNEWIYTITCSWTDPAGAYHVFTDKIRLHFDPNFELTHRKTIRVYVDKNDPHKYYMDLEFLKELDKRRR